MNKTLPNWRIDSGMESCAGEVPDAGRSGGRGGGKNKQELDTCSEGHGEAIASREHS